MAKKRKLNVNTLQAEFWTARPIDECRARVIKLLRKSILTKYHDALVPDKSDQFDTFEFTRFHYVRGQRRYRVDIQGHLQSTIDGTRVTLKVTPESSKILREFTWWVRTIAVGAVVTIVYTLTLLLTQPQNLISDRTLDISIADARAQALIAGPILITILGFITFMAWAVQRTSANIAPTVLAEIRDELYVPHHAPKHHDVAQSD